MSHLDDALDALLQQQADDLFNLLWPLVLSMTHDGARGGGAQVQEAFGLAVDWDRAHPEIEKQTRRELKRVLSQMGANTRARVFEQVKTFRTTPGSTLQDLIDNIKDRSMSEYRAGNIAITETTRYFAIGSQAAHQAAGIEKQLWQTNHDEIVCPICSPLNQTVKAIGAAFGEDVFGEPLLMPPAHPGCRCWLSPVAD